MLTDKELAAVPEELLKDLLRYSEYGWRDRRIVSLLARSYPVVLTEADVRKLRRLALFYQSVLPDQRIIVLRPALALFQRELGMCQHGGKRKGKKENWPWE